MPDLAIQDLPDILTVIPAIDTQRELILLGIDNLNSGNSEQLALETLIDYILAQATLITNARKRGADNIGASATIDFDAGLFDNKITKFTGNETVSIVSPAASGEYKLHISSSSAAKRELTWQVTGGGSFASNVNLPSFIDFTEGIWLQFNYNAVTQVFSLQEFPTFTKITDGTAVASGNWKLDCANGLYLNHIVTGAVGAGVILDTPLNLPLDQVMLITLNAAQTNLTFSNNWIKSGLLPDMDGITSIAIYRNATGYFIRANDQETW